MDPIVRIFHAVKDTYHLRLTHPDLQLKKTFKGLKSFSAIIVAQEGGDDNVALHQHVLIAHKGVTRDQIKDIIKDVYPGVKGNKMFSLVKAKSQQQLARYCVKDGDFLYQGYTPQQMEFLVKTAYDNKALLKGFTVLKDKLIAGQIDFETYMLQYFKLKGEALQPVYMQHAIAHFTSIGLKTGHVDPQDLVDRCHAKIFSNPL